MLIKVLLRLNLMLHPEHVRRRNLRLFRVQTGIDRLRQFQYSAIVSGQGHLTGEHSRF